MAADRPLPDSSHVAQPYAYSGAVQPITPDWRRLPGYHRVTASEWASVAWQRQHSVRTVADLRLVFGDHLPAALADAIAADQREYATMPLLVTPQILNTMDEAHLWEDPVRRYMLPAQTDRGRDWCSHPLAQRDSLHERDMWPVEGLTHRYPYKVLVEVTTSCPQYCGYCTRMDLVGTSTPQVQKQRFTVPPGPRYAAMLEYIRSHAGIRDVVVSGGDVANMRPRELEAFVSELAIIPHVRDIRLGMKALAGLPQHVLNPDTLASFARMAAVARGNDVDLAVHTHINHPRQVTAEVSQAARRLLDAGVREVRNQSVLIRGVNDSAQTILDLCFVLIDAAHIVPYYIFMCDMIPNAEHWRVPLYQAQQIQNDIMGYLPGFKTPRVTCDVPFVGKKLVHQASAYDRQTGVSFWTKNYLTSCDDLPGHVREWRQCYCDPIWSLPKEGCEYWRRVLATREVN